MDDKHVKELLEEAKKYIKDPDSIIDPYDMTHVWVSERGQARFGKDVAGHKVASTSEHPEGLEDFRQMSLDAVTMDGKVKEKKILLNLGEEKKLVLINYIVIEYNRQPYLITKVMKYLD